jgi:imidazolonepropionase-like amidohydrolase
MQSATLTPAKMLGKEADFGSIEAGKRADLILVQGDPLSDVSTLREPVWVMHHGEMRAAKAWLEEGETQDQER